MFGVGRDLWGPPAQPLAQAGSPRAGCTAPRPGGAGISPEKETPQPPWAAWARAPSPLEEEVLPHLQTEKSQGLGARRPPLATGSSDGLSTDGATRGKRQRRRGTGNRTTREARRRGCHRPASGTRRRGAAGVERGVTAALGRSPARGRGAGSCGQGLSSLCGQGLHLARGLPALLPTACPARSVVWGTQRCAAPGGHLTRSCGTRDAPGEMGQLGTAGDSSVPPLPPQDREPRGATCPACSPGQHPETTPACLSLRSPPGMSPSPGSLPARRLEGCPRGARAFAGK